MMLHHMTHVLISVSILIPELGAQTDPAGVTTIQQLLLDNGVRGAVSLSDDIGGMRIVHAPSNSQSDENEFLFAGYAVSERLPGGRRMDPRLHVVLADRRAGAIRYRAVTPNEYPGQGSVSRIVRTDQYIVVSLQLTPSAANTVVLDRNLEVLGGFFGWPLAVLPNEALVFQNSMVHFAPTSMARVSVYDPARRIEREIYPPANYDPVRLEYIERVRGVYAEIGEAWFRANNHHMDPERFNSSVLWVVVDAGASIIAFLGRYGREDDLVESRQDVVVTCVSMDRIDEITCRERPIEVWLDALGVSPTDIRTPPDTFDEARTVERLLRPAAARPRSVP